MRGVLAGGALDDSSALNPGHNPLRLPWSGKSTLLNDLLAHPEFGDTAVVINEFGTSLSITILFVSASAR